MDNSIAITLIENLSKEWDSPAAELAEITIDSLLTDGLIKEIPIVSSLIAFYKTGLGIRDILFARKLQQFLFNYHSNKSTSDYQNFKTKIEKININELNIHLITIIEKIESEKKVKILNNLFNAFLSEKIDYENFLNLSLIINSLHPLGFDFLKEMGESTNPFRLFIEYSKNSLVTILNMAGLILSESVNGGTAITVNKLGQDFYKFGILEQ